MPGVLHSLAVAEASELISLNGESSMSLPQDVSHAPGIYPGLCYICSAVAACAGLAYQKLMVIFRGTCE